MSYVSELDSDKPVKRVRFSEKCENVYEFEREEIHGDFSLENNNIILSGVTEELGKKDPGKETVADSTFNNNELEKPDELSSSIINVDDSKDVSNNSLSFEKFANDAAICPISEVRGSDAEINDLMELIHETNCMTISSSESEEENQPFRDKNALYSTPFGKNFITGVKIDLKPVEQNIGCNKTEPYVSRKRSLAGTFIGRQTAKMNICLRENTPEICSAGELKISVFNAWNKVKDEETSIQGKPDTKSASVTPDIKQLIENTEVSPTPFEAWRASLKGRKNPKMPNSSSQKAAADLEESKMAFRAWKKKKDALIRKEITAKYVEEEKQRLDSIMNERMRKKEAESAYSAWNSHKVAISRMEKKKSLWIVEREKEIMNQKMKKHETAANSYYEWLKSKAHSTKYNTYGASADKPPWTPPGRANSSI